MSGASIIKVVKPKRIQVADIQTAAGWGMVAFTGAVWVVQVSFLFYCLFMWISKNYVS
ncbi:hypothetical protein MKX01_012416 [Papaver californicum]|nr:hypothetical protein MKX01_012416 [Papaver californicum]